MVNIAINGLGRIGRCVMRALEELNYSDINIVAVNSPTSIEQNIHLLKYDSVHGQFNGKIESSGEYLLFGKTKAKLTHERDLHKLHWQDVDIVLECTGKFNSKDKAEIHIKQGAKKVLVSAPCKNSDATVVYGVNNEVLQDTDQVISVGSCTTNCLAPVAYILHKHLTIQSGFMTTIHSYTGDQRVLDGSHKDMRRARSCGVSMVPTSTGAAKSIGLVIPELAGKLAGSAVRVPTPNVSLVDLSVNTKKATTVAELKKLFNQYADGSMRGILQVTEESLVSVDFNHNPHSAIIDLHELHVIDNNLCRVLAWYDNEWGFSVRMLDLTRVIANML